MRGRTIEDTVADVMRQLERDEARVVFDVETGTVEIRMRWRRMGSMRPDRGERRAVLRCRRWYWSRAVAQ
jgi:hypothetical protein